MQRGEELAAAISVDDGPSDDLRLRTKAQRYRERWADAWQDACTAVVVPAEAARRGAQPSERQRCLEESARVVGVDLGLLAKIPLGARRAALGSNLRMASWPSIEACERAGTWVESPSTDERRARLRAKIDEARRVQLVDDDTTTAARLLREALTEATEAGEHHIAATAGLALANLPQRGGEARSAELVAVLEQARSLPCAPRTTC